MSAICEPAEGAQLSTYDGEVRAWRACLAHHSGCVSVTQLLSRRWQDAEAGCGYVKHGWGCGTVGRHHSAGHALLHSTLCRLPGYLRNSRGTPRRLGQLLPTHVPFVT